MYLMACEVDLVDFVASWQQAVQQRKIIAFEVNLKKAKRPERGESGFSRRILASPTA